MNSHLKMVISLFFCLMLKPLCAVSNFQENFLRANEHYKAGEFQQAYSLYQEIPFRTPGLYYNLGNCAYKLNKYGYALLWWRRAEKDWGLFNRQELKNNILLVKKKLAQKYKGDLLPPKTGLWYFYASIKNFLFSFIQSFRFLFLQLFFLLFWVLFLLYYRFLYKPEKKYIFLTLLMLVLSSGLIIGLKYCLQFYDYGVVVEREDSLLSGPDKTFQVLTKLPEGTEGTIKRESGGYYKIMVDGSIGWVHSDRFKKI